MKKAFTIVEIMIVIVIIGTLAALALPRFVGTNESMICSEAIGHLSTLRAAQARYFLDKGVYAGEDCSALDVDVTPKNFNNLRCNAGTGAVSLTRNAGTAYTATVAQSGSPIYSCSGAGCTTAVTRACFTQ